MTNGSNKLKTKTVVGYGLGDLGINLYFNLVTVFLLIFYTDVLGIGPAVAGTIILLARVSDAVTDPLMGVIAHRTRHKTGRYRPWILWGAPLLAVSTIALFWVPPLGEDGRIAYAATTFVVFGVAYTVVNIPYLSLNAALTDDGDGRTRLAASRLVCGFIGGFAVFVAVPILISAFGGAESGTTAAVAVLSAVATGLLIICYSSTEERTLPIDEPIRSFTESIGDMRRVLSGNHALYIVQVAFVLLYIGITMRSAGLLYFFRYNIESEAAFPIVGAVLLGATILGALATARLARRFDRIKLLQWCGIGCAVPSLILTAMFWDPPTLAQMSRAYAAAALVLLVIASVLSGPPLVTLWALLADTVDYGELKSNVRSEASVYAVSSFVFKLAKGVGAGGAGFILAWAGFQSEAAQTAEAKVAISMLTIGGPALAILLAPLVMLLFPLDDRAINTMKDELNRRRLGQAVPE